MDYTPTLVTAPTSKPVTVPEVKRHCRISSTNTADDELLNHLIDVAVAHFDGYNGILGRCLITQTWKQTFDRFQDVMRLPFPVQSITSVKYLDADGVEQTLDASYYDLRHDGLSSFVQRDRSLLWPTIKADPEAVRVTFVAGFGSASNVPAPLRQAILLSVGTLYSQTREDAGLRRIVIDGVGSKDWDTRMLDMNQAAIDRLVAPYRLYPR